MNARRRLQIPAVAATVILAACGSTNADDATDGLSVPAATDATVATIAPIAPIATGDVPQEPEPITATDPPDTAEQPAEQPAATSTEAPITAPASTGTTTTATTTTTTTTAPAAAAPAVAEIGGRAFADTASAASDIATNSLPDLLVDDVRRATKINLRNVFPADRPVLIWMWAPH